MKLFALIPLIAGITLSSVASANIKSCLRSYSTLYVSSKIFSKAELKQLIKENKSFEGFYQTSSDRRIYLKFESGDPTKPLVFDTHGLGDSHIDMQALNQLINKEGKGYRTLRVDTHLNGKTLENFLAENNFKIPPYFHYKKNTYDLAEIILETGIKDVLMVGHSYGGGLAWDITSHINKKINYDLILKLKHNKKGSSLLTRQNEQKIREEMISKISPIKAVVQLSPYLQRADKYLAEKMTNMTIVPDSMATIISTLASFGVPESFLEKISAPWINLSLEQVDEIRKTLAFPKRIIDFSMGQKVNDMIMDPFMDQFMQKNFSAYFIHKAKVALKKETLSEADMKLIDKKVEASIALTKGIRPFDILERANNLQWLKSIPILLIGGEKDTLVSPLQLQDFTKRLEEAGISYKFFVIQDGTHLFPQTHADKVIILIEQFFDEILKTNPE